MAQPFDAHRPAQDGRLAGADFIRAVACLMVILHHLLQRLDFSALPEGVRPIAAFGLNGSFGVAAFFVLSGYLLSRPFWKSLLAGQRFPSLQIYALRRAARIVPAFWLALTVAFVLGVTAFGSRLDAMTVFRYLAGLLLIGGWHWSIVFPVDFDGPLWSIGFEVASYVFLPIGMAVLFWLRARSVGTALAAWLGVMLAIDALNWLVVSYLPVETAGAGWQFGLIGGSKEWVPRFSPVSFFAIFAIGGLAGGLQVGVRLRPPLLADALALAGIAIAGGSMIAAMNGPTEGYGFLGIPCGYPWFPAGVALILMAAPSSRTFARLADNPVIRFIARISFGLYLWHFLVLEVIGHFWIAGASTGGMTNLSLWFTVGAVDVAASVAIASLSFTLVERPVMRLAHGLESRNRDRP